MGFTGVLDHAPKWAIKQNQAHRCTPRCQVRVGKIKHALAATNNEATAEPEVSGVASKDPEYPLAPTMPMTRPSTAPPSTWNPASNTDRLTLPRRARPTSNLPRNRRLKPSWGKMYEGSAENECKGHEQKPAVLPLLDAGLVRVDGAPHGQATGRRTTLAAWQRARVRRPTEQ